MTTPPKRVSPIHAPDEYLLPVRPESATDSVLDAYRQTQFLLGGELPVFADAMRLQLRLMHDAYPSQFRTPVFAAIAGLWSRAYRYLADTALLLTRASYSSTLPIIRTACEMLAAEEAIRAGETDEYHQWLDSALAPSTLQKAVDFELGPFFAGSVLASDPVLGRVYRPVSNLSRPHFGATLLQVGPESNNLRLAITFADASFHLGWAELIAGWLLALAIRQVRIAIDAEPLLPVSDDVRLAYAELSARTEKALGRDDRCSVEEVDEAGFHRYLFHNFRRTSGAAPKKILL